jgi:hypothetical protein
MRNRGKIALECGHGGREQSGPHRFTGFGAALIGVLDEPAVRVGDFGSGSCIPERAARGIGGRSGVILSRAHGHTIRQPQRFDHGYRIVTSHSYPGARSSMRCATGCVPRANVFSAKDERCLTLAAFTFVMPHWGRAGEGSTALRVPSRGVQRLPASGGVCSHSWRRRGKQKHGRGIPRPCS